MYLVDGPKVLEGPVRDLLEAMPFPHAIANAAPKCAGDDDCPGTSRQHCCCCPHKEATGVMSAECAAQHAHGRRANGHSVCGDGSRGAPEAMGLCTPRKRCAKLSTRTHSFDFGAKAWLLPFLADSTGLLRPERCRPSESRRRPVVLVGADHAEKQATARFLRRLATNMTYHGPWRRASFSDAISMLDDFSSA